MTVGAGKIALDALTDCYRRFVSMYAKADWYSIDVMAAVHFEMCWRQ